MPHLRRRASDEPIGEERLERPDSRKSGDTGSRGDIAPACEQASRSAPGRRQTRAGYGGVAEGKQAEPATHLLREGGDCGENRILPDCRFENHPRMEIVACGGFDVKIFAALYVEGRKKVALEWGERCAVTALRRPLCLLCRVFIWSVKTLIRLLLRLPARGQSDTRCQTAGGAGTSSISGTIIELQAQIASRPTCEMAIQKRALKRFKRARIAVSGARCMTRTCRRDGRGGMEYHILGLRILHLPCQY